MHADELVRLGSHLDLEVDRRLLEAEPGVALGHIAVRRPGALGLCPRVFDVDTSSGDRATIGRFVSRSRGA